MKRNGFTFRSLLITLILLGVVGAAVLGGWKFFFSGKGGKVNLIYSHVTRGTFFHEITGKGNAASAKNIDITCQVESASGTTVLWIIPEGETVKKGNDLVLLDSSDLEDKASTQQITCNSNTATVASSQASLRTAELSLEEYIEGTFEQNWMTIENELYSAREEQKKASDNVAYYKKLVQFGYTTPIQLESYEVEEQKHINTVKSNLLKQSVLLKYTSEKEITKLMADIETARAKLSSDTYTAELAKNRLDHFLQMLANCSITAPQDGQVVYANEDSWRRSESDIIKEGSTVRAQQVLIRLPDPSQMQIKAMINESNIANVKVGMKADIIFDALSTQSFDGEVIKVNQYPEFNWMSSSKDYVTIVRIDKPTEQIRSGMTAQVKIESKRIPDVLMLPVQCIVEVSGKNYVLTCNEGVWDYKEVKLGLSNDKQVIIEEGLSEGDRVVGGARLYKNKVNFPETPVADSALQGDQKATDQAKGNVDAPKKPEGGVFPDPPIGAGPMMGGEMAPASSGDHGSNDGKRSRRGSRGDRSAGGPSAERALPEGGPAGPDGKPSVETDLKAEMDKALVPAVATLIKDAEKATFTRLGTIKDQFSWTAMEICQKVDTNFDKEITKEEIEATVPACLPFFDQWDRGQKGTLTRTDLVIGFCTARINYQKMESLFAQKDETVDDSKFLLKKEPSAILLLLDQNGDNALTEEDIPDYDMETFHSLLKRFDANTDGKVNAEELTTGVTEFKQRLTQSKQNAVTDNPGQPAPPPSPR